VATPIGNLSDLSHPAQPPSLAAADLIAVEDSRVTGKLLNHIGVKRPMTPYHDHNADAVRPRLIERAWPPRRWRWSAMPARRSFPIPASSWCAMPARQGRQGRDDPRPVRRRWPGLTLAGLPTDRFLFMGFLPAKQGQKEATITEVAAVRATLVFYESGPRLGATLATLARLLGPREAAVARELTKTFEECVTGSLPDLAARYADAPPKGEIVLMVGPPGEPEPASDAEGDAALIEAL
jgi:16S rRNA (cytidine1402-2'-O)-methyltransferase